MNVRHQFAPQCGEVLCLTKLQKQIEFLTIVLTNVRPIFVFEFRGARCVKFRGECLTNKFGRESGCIES